MINTCKETRKINSFQFVAIPSPRDIFNKYGERINNNAYYTCDVNGNADCICTAQTTIGQMVHAQRSLEKAVRQ